MFWDLIDFKDVRVKTRYCRGFTAVELLVVTIIIAIIAAVAIPAYISSVELAQQKKAAANMSAIYNAQIEYFFSPQQADPANPVYASGIGTLQASANDLTVDTFVDDDGRWTYDTQQAGTGFIVRADYYHTGDGHWLELRSPGAAGGVKTLTKDGSGPTWWQ